MTAGLRIATVTAHHGRDGGIGAHVASVAEALTAAGHTVDVVAAGSDAGQTAATRLVEGLDEAALGDEAAERFRALVDELEPDVIHLHDVRDPSLADWCAERAPTVWSIHQFVASTSGYKYFRKPGDMCVRAHGPGCIPNLVFRGCAHRRDPRPVISKYRRTTRTVRALRRVHLTLPCSTYVAQHLETNGVPRIRVAWPFVERVPQTRALPAEPRVMFAGRIDPPAKGIGVLLRAMQHVDAPLDVWGDGWWLDGARRLAERLGVGARVAFRGWGSAAQLEEAYSSASVVALPSLWPEPFGIVGIEAMASGRPVVASDVGGIPDWHAGEANGILVAPGDVRALADALNSLLAAPDRCRELGEAGAERVRAHFTPDRYVETVDAAYEQVLAAARRGSTRNTNT